MSVHFFGFAGERILCLFGAIPLGFCLIVPLCSTRTGSCTVIWATLVSATTITVVIALIHTLYYLSSVLWQSGDDFSVGCLYLEFTVSTEAHYDPKPLLSTFGINDLYVVTDVWCIITTVVLDLVFYVDDVVVCSVMVWPYCVVVLVHSFVWWVHTPVPRSDLLLYCGQSSFESILLDA